MRQGDGAFLLLQPQVLPGPLPVLYLALQHGVALGLLLELRQPLQELRYHLLQILRLPEALQLEVDVLVHDLDEDAQVLAGAGVARVGQLPALPEDLRDVVVVFLRRDTSTNFLLLKRWVQSSSNSACSFFFSSFEANCVTLCARLL